MSLTRRQASVRLPNEILLLISSYYMGEYLHDEDDPYYTTLQTDEGAWLLTHICHAWRKTVISASRFWCDIRLNVFRGEKISGENWTHYMYLINLQLLRSRDQPLCICIEIDQGFQTPIPGYGCLAWMLFSNRRRWKVLDFPNCCRPLYHAIHSLGSPLECPLLEHITMNVAQVHGHSFGRLRFDRLPPVSRFLSDTGCPRLTSARIHNMYPGLPWARLEKIELRLTNVAQFFPRVQHDLPLLTSLTLYRCIYALAFPFSQGRDPLPTLRTLVISPMSQIDLLHMIMTPRLESLRVETVTSARNVAAIASLVHRSQCPITHLRCSVYHHWQQLLLTSLLDAVGNTIQDLEVILLPTPPDDTEMDSDSDSNFGDDEMNLYETINTLDWMVGSSFKYCPNRRHISVSWDYLGLDYWEWEKIRGLIQNRPTRRHELGSETIEMDDDENLMTWDWWANGAD